MRKQLERTLEGRCVRYATQVLGLTHRKMNGLGNRDWPDQLFAPRRQPGRALVELDHCNPVLWVEFKREGKEPTEKQARKHVELAERGQLVYVVDNFEEFKRVADAYSAQNGGRRGKKR